ncbi:MAG TPA: DUF507 family protein [Terriglobia bacterium]|nr:DUF507 family protein [Terriglobia bacterium]
MKLSHEKVIQLSHRMIAAIEGLDEIDYREDLNTIRLEIVKILNDLVREEEKIDAAVRLHITSQKRTIPEGGEEWDILYRKYYQEQLRKLGIQSAAPPRT